MFKLRFDWYITTLSRHLLYMTNAPPMVTLREKTGCQQTNAFRVLVISCSLAFSITQTFQCPGVTTFHHSSSSKSPRQVSSLSVGH